MSSPMLYGSGITSCPLVLWLQAPLQKSVVVGSLIIPAQANNEVLSLDNQQEEVNFKNFQKSRLRMLVVSDW